MQTSSVLIRMNGYYVRPEWKGGTSFPLEAGVFDRDVAEKYIKETEGASIVEITDAI